MMRNAFSLTILLAMAIVAAQPLGAEGRQRGRPGRAGNPPAIADSAAPMNTAEVMRVLDGYALVQAQESLQLNEAQYGRFVTRLKNLQDVRRRNLQARHRIVQELRRLAGPQATGAGDDTAIRQQLKALRDHEERAADEVRKAYDALDEVLDGRQQARFRLFEERLELRKMDLLMRARQGAARRQDR